MDDREVAKATAAFREQLDKAEHDITMLFYKRQVEVTQQFIQKHRDYQLSHLLIALVLLCLAIILCAATPLFDPGDPYVSKMTDIELQVLWPYSKTLRGDTWECLVIVSNEDYEFYTLTLHGNPKSTSEHVRLSVIWAFGDKNWFVTDGSCFILYNDSVRYTRPIVNLPFSRAPIGGNLDNYVFLPGIMR